MVITFVGPEIISTTTAGAARLRFASFSFYFFGSLVASTAYIFIAKAPSFLYFLLCGATTTQGARKLRVENLRGDTTRKNNV